MTRRGEWIRAFAASILDARTMERVITPAVADLQHEPFSMSRYLAVWKTIALCVPEIPVRMGAVATLSVVVMLVVVGLLEIPALVFAFEQRAFDFLVPVYLIPQGLSIAATIAVMLGILYVFRRRALSRRTAAIAMCVAVVVSVVSFLNAGWLTPVANQAFRNELVHQNRTVWRVLQVERGFPELTFGEVRRQYALATANAAAVDPIDLHYLAVSYHGRWAVTFAPIVFAAFALVLCRRKPVTRWTAATVACAAYLSYLFYLSVPRLPALDGAWLGGAAWYPEIALAVMTGILLLTSRHETHVAAR